MDTTSEPNLLTTPNVLDAENGDSEVEKKQRVIFIDHLRWPGNWMNNRQINRQLSKCLTFTAHFSRAAGTSDKHVKSGSIELEFSSADSAREAYVNLQKLVVDGLKTPLRVDDVFFKPAASNNTKSYFATPEDEDVNKSTIYALYLPRGVDKQLLESIVGAEVIQHFRILPLPNSNGLHQAEIVAISEDAAANARSEGDDFEIDDGVQPTIVKLLTPKEYKEVVKKATAAKPFVVDQQDKENETPIENEEEDDENVMKAPEIDEDEVVEKLLKHIEDQKVNWAELSTKEEIYSLADLVSQDYKGLPDSILKPVMLTALQRHLTRAESHWMREHLEGIIKMWKIEVMSEVFFDRPSVIRMETIDYKPQPKASKKQKNREETKKQGRMMLGLGAFLQQSGQKLQTDTGDHEVEEDEDGNFLIDGEELSFETWSKFTKSNTGVIRAEPEKISKKQQRLQRTVQNMTQEQYKAWKKSQINNRRADLKRRHMQAGAMIEEDEQEEEEASVSTKPPKELDEGEIDSEEEKKSKKPAKKRRKKGTESSSSSSDSDSDDSSSSDDGDAKDARQRRKMRRKKDRKTKSIVKGPVISPFLRQVFEQRKQVVAVLSPAHKLELANVLNQMRQKNSKLSDRQQTTMINAMSEMFANNGFY